MLSEIPQLSWFFLLLFTLNGFTVILILILKNKLLGSRQFMLALFLMGITFASIVICLVETRVILKVPFLFRLPSPLYYLMFPAAYLYVKLIIKDRTSLKKTEYLHFLPALVHLIEMIPFYLKSNTDKILVINNIYSHDINMYAHGEGWLPPFMHNIIRGILGIGYAIAMWQLLKKSKINVSLSNKIYFGKILQWLRIFTIMNGMIGIVGIEALTIIIIPSEIRSLSLHITFIVILIILDYYLLFHPEILYGLPQLSTPKASNLESKKGEMKMNTKGLSNSLSTSDTKKEENEPLLMHEYRTQVHNYIIQSQVYLKPDFDIIDLSRDTNIPVQHLRLLINKNEGQRFNDFINQYRMQHMQTLINNGKLLNKTLEALAFECGFSSKPAFIRGIKKLTNQTPGAYFNQRKAVPDQEIL